MNVDRLCVIAWAIFLYVRAKMDGMKAEQLTLGRMEILTDAEYINEDNLINELDRALVAHRVNRSNIQYLWNYYRGRQDIQYKTKIVRPEINHKVTVNKASQIVKFKESREMVKGSLRMRH